MKTKTKSGLNLKPEERFLVEKLPDVLRLEAAMEGIRQKYYQFWDDIGRRVQREHPTLNRWYNHATRSDAQVGIARGCWPSATSNLPSGFFIVNISLECLCSTDVAAPFAQIFLVPLPKMRGQLESMREPFRQKAEQQLGLKLDSYSNLGIDLYFGLPESRERLLGMLMTKKQEAKFANCMVSHFAQLAKLIPEIDKVFNAGKKRGG